MTEMVLLILAGVAVGVAVSAALAWLRPWSAESEGQGGSRHRGALPRKGAARLFDAGPVAVLSIDPRPPHRVLRASASFTVPEGTALADWLHPEDAEAVARRVARPAAAAATWDVEVRQRGPNGAWLRRQLRGLGGVSAVRGPVPLTVIDLEPLRQAELRAEEKEQELQDVVRKMTATQDFLQGLQHLTDRLQVCSGEQEATQLIAAGAAELFPRWSGAVSMADSAGRMQLACQWGRFLCQDGCAEADCWALRLDRLHQMPANGPGESAPVCSHLGNGLPAEVKHALCVPLPGWHEGGSALHLMTREPMDARALRAAAWGAQSLADALRLSLANLRLRMTLREQAVRDWMTGLYNRRHFDEVLHREVNRAQRNGDRLTLGLLDIDHFKSFNDTFGHEAGDQVIKAVARQLLGFVRSYDIACRVGGEELAVLMPRASLEETCARLDDLRLQIAALRITHDGVALPAVTVSIGVSDVAQGSDLEMLRRADVALYAAKHDGRNRISCWTPSIEAASFFGAFDDSNRVVSPPTAEKPRLFSR